MNIIEARNLTKEFDGFKAIDNISFEIQEGEIFGLLESNQQRYKIYKTKRA